MPSSTDVRSGRLGSGPSSKGPPAAGRMPGAERGHSAHRRLGGVGGLGVRVCRRVEHIVSLRAIGVDTPRSRRRHLPPLPAPAIVLNVAPNKELPVGS